MKKLLAIGTAAILAGMNSLSAQIFISEVVDATLPGGLPKFVELYNAGATSVDLSNYSIGNFNNGGTTLGGGSSTVLSGTLLAGDAYVISYENPAQEGGTTLFFDTFGFNPDFEIGPFTNGDDAYALFMGVATGDGSDATLVDLYGVVGVDGTGELWEYTDGFSYRLPAYANPNATFTSTEWFFGGANSLEDPGGDDLIEAALILSLTTPGLHSVSEVPEPSTYAFILGLLALGYVAYRRRK